MCGICGVASPTPLPAQRARLDRMNETLVHRGPDSGGIFLEDGAGIAARRLAIIDLETGDQPLTNEDGSIAVVQNGEIYNYRELRDQLVRSGHRFRTRGDTEVLAHLYEERGLAFAEPLRGMFAVAVVDRRRRRVVLARDRFGIKPLYYRLAGRTLSFASELKALLSQPDVSRELDPCALEAFLTFSFVPAPLSIFRDIRKLPPGSVLSWEAQSGSEVSIEQFSAPVPATPDEMRRERVEDLAEELRERLRDSVRAHLVSDVPVGILLSGGIDSSTLTALACQIGGRVDTFTIGFEERGFDERSRARLVAERYDTNHHEAVLHPDAVELLPALAETFDEPFGDSSAIPTFLVSRLAREHVKVVLTGEGGDELFGGYDLYSGHALARTLAPVASLLRPLADRLPASTGRASSLDSRAKRFAHGAGLAALERHCAWRSIFTAEERNALFRRELQVGPRPIDLLRESYDASAGADDLARLMSVDLRLFLADDMLVKTDRATMAHSLEARTPLLDSVVSDLALRLPSELHVRRLGKKRLFRRAVAPLLPREVMRGPKRGFSLPVGAWLRGPLAPIVQETLAPERVRKQGFFETTAVTALVEAHASGRVDNSRKLWALLTFSLWLDRYGEGPVPSPVPTHH
jgi:asparagine synthase (glutamine-hydrolysing)